MKRVRVAWTVTERFEAVLEVEDHQVRDPEAAFDGGSDELVELESKEAIHGGRSAFTGVTEREVESVTLLEDDEPAVSYGVGR